MFVRNMLAAAVVFGYAAGLSAAAEPGKPAPAFELKDENGKAHKLADFKDKVVVLVWVNPGDADGDKGCPFITGRYESGFFEKQATEAKKDGAVYIAVNSSHFNTPEISKAVAEKRKLSYPTLQDADGKVGNEYGAKTTPHAFVIGKDGNVVYSGAINDNNSPDAAKDTGAKDYVLAAVKAASKGEKPEVTETKPFGCSVKYKK